MKKHLMLAVGGVVLAELVAGCGGKKKDVTDEDAVMLMYENFVPTIYKLTTAGIAAKDTAAQGANIPNITLTGDVMGTGTMGGTVAQSGGQNQNLSLVVELNDYSDTGDVVYQTDNTSESTKLQFGLQITNQPADNSASGDIDGTLTLDGDVEGTGIFDLHTETDLDDDDANPAIICTRVTGTVTAGGDSNTVDFVIPGNLTLTSSQAAACAAL